jgi:hypothetical protein
LAENVDRCGQSSINILNDLSTERSQLAKNLQLTLPTLDKLIKDEESRFYICSLYHIIE